ncbi:MAG: 23S rRNA (guanosine(2251)-2'-O)-methyltransferase RlmB [Sphingobacteriales bacterium]|nr:MAG: 23S rRNA (guanosine(2251)-2'-O)-methyltransferase RlmB [Sphingobacteriales bacterium]
MSIQEESYVYRLPDNLVYGRNPVIEAFQAGKEFEKLFVQKGLGGDAIKTILQYSHQQETLVQMVPIEKLNRLTGNKNHQGVAGFTSLIKYYELEDILSEAYNSANPPLLLICDGITDVGNFGAMARTAACTGVNGIIIPQKGAATISAEAIKASSGALYEIPVCKVRFLDRSIHYLQENGVQVIATDISAQKWIHQTDLTIPTAIIMGAEGKGVSPVFMKMANEKAKIPMTGNFNSYNVSVATGIILYETLRQRLIQMG